MKDLRSALESKTYTEETLQLTEDALDLLASHYTTWHFRLAIIRHLKKPLLDELDWCEQVALENEKNYQIWNYRQNIIEDILADPSVSFSYKREYPILAIMLEKDPKNHHVWSYRKWLVERFGLHTNPEELQFTKDLIDADARNNSAWTHRFFLNFGKTALTGKALQTEIAMVKLYIDLCPQNPSLWNYLRGIYNHLDLNICDLKAFCSPYADLSKDKIGSTYALEMLATIAAAEGAQETASEIFNALATKYDPIRANYWNFLRKQTDS